jgi:hypothetical protein
MGLGFKPFTGIGNVTNDLESGSIRVASTGIEIILILRRVSPHQPTANGYSNSMWLNPLIAMSNDQNPFTLVSPIFFWRQIRHQLVYRLTRNTDHCRATRNVHLITIISLGNVVLLINLHFENNRSTRMTEHMKTCTNRLRTPVSNEIITTSAKQDLAKLYSLSLTCRMTQNTQPYLLSAIFLRLN